MPQTIRGLPITNGQLKSLFDWLDRPNPPVCTHTFKETVEFLSKNHLPVKPTLKWLRANGAECDCEVTYNVDTEWGKAVGRVPKA